MIFPTYTDGNLGIRVCVGMDINMGNNGRRNTRLGQVEFIGMSPLSRDSGFSVVARGLRKALTVYLVGWLTHGSKGSRHK